MPTIPLKFNPPADEVLQHLEQKKVAAGTEITWRPAGASIIVPIEPYDPDLDWLRRVEAFNAPRLVLHGTHGFSLGSYHEFFVSDPLRPSATYIIGDAEISFGEASPLAAYLFEPYRSKYNGQWYEIESVRILGVALEDHELAFLNACLRREEHTGYWPQLAHLGEPYWADTDNEDPPAPRTALPLIQALEPLRFFEAAARQDEPAAACISFYRVIEYYAFLASAREVGNLRRDNAISDTDFMRRALDLTTRNERTPIMRLIKALADRPMIDAAASAKLVSRADAEAFASAVYEFRNSIVHGKYGAEFTLASSSSLSPDLQAAAWLPHMRSLARRALATPIPWQ